MRRMGVAVMMLAGCPQLMVGQAAVEQDKEKPPIVRSIKYENFRRITIQEILRTFEEKGVNLKVEMAFDQTEVDHAKTVLTDLLMERGRPNPRVKVDVAMIPPRSIEIRFTNEEP
jgi:hypothetical protein